MSRTMRRIKNGDRVRIRLLDSGEAFEATLDMHLDPDLPIQVTQCSGEKKTLIPSQGEYEISRLD